MTAPGQPRAGGDSRGSSYTRRNRKFKLLRVFGDGTTAPCVHCHKALTFETIESDRIVPGSRGGTYRFENVQPSCSKCNKDRSDDEDWTSPVAAFARFQEVVYALDFLPFTAPLTEHDFRCLAR